MIFQKNVSSLTFATSKKSLEDKNWKLIKESEPKREFWLKEGRVPEKPAGEVEYWEEAIRGVASREIKNPTHPPWRKKANRERITELLLGHALDKLKPGRCCPKERLDTAVSISGLD